MVSEFSKTTPICLAWGWSSLGLLGEYHIHADQQLARTALFRRGIRKSRGRVRSFLPARDFGQKDRSRLRVTVSEKGGVPQLGVDSLLMEAIGTNDPGNRGSCCKASSEVRRHVLISQNPATFTFIAACSPKPSKVREKWKRLAGAIVVKGLLVRCEKTRPSTGELALGGRHAVFNGCLSAYRRLFRRLHRQ